MKYSPIAPIKLLQQIHQAGYLGGYVLVLAHDILDHPDEYRELLVSLRIEKGDDEVFVILDNSLIELGYPMPPKDLRRAAVIVGANCLILPDVLGNAVKTVDLGWRFYHDTKKHAALHDIPLMAVPQGKTVEEHVLCARLLRQIPNVHYWGIPRNVANVFESRALEPLERELGYGKHFNGVTNVHMLGMSRNFQDDIACARLPGVMGIDSANPCVLGQADFKIESHDTIIPHRDRGDFWEHTTLRQATLVNINTVREMLNGV